jgi:protein TonB
MIAKKNSRYDLERKRIVLFQIGLLTAGSFTWAAFTYSTPVKTQQEKLAVTFEPVYFQLEEPEIEKPEPVVQPPEIQNKDDQQTAGLTDQSISDAINVTVNTSDLPIPGVDLPIVGQPGDGVLGVLVDVTGEDIDPFPPVEAQYIGGPPKMQEEILTKLKYPQIDIELGNQGTVYVSFVVEKDGSISNVKIERGISETIDREAKRIVQNFPKWKPAENAYGKVRTIVRLPIKFIIAK